LLQVHSLDDVSLLLEAMDATARAVLIEVLFSVLHAPVGLSLLVSGHCFA
jgi:hypothetical protein